MPKMTFIERDGTRREVDAPLGLSDDAAARTLRIGVGRFTSPADVDYAVAALAAAHAGAPAPGIEQLAKA